MVAIQLYKNTNERCSNVGHFVPNERLACNIFIFTVSAIVVIVVAPSGFFGKARKEVEDDLPSKYDRAVGISTSSAPRSGRAGGTSGGHFHQFCDLEVPTLMPAPHSEDELVMQALAVESTAAYRLLQRQG